MNWRLASAYKNHSSTRIVNAISKRLMLAGAVVLVATIPVLPQNPELHEKLAAVKAVAAENKQQLRQYQWTETIQLTLKGDAKPPTQNLCQYGPDGQVQKTPIGPPPGTTQRWTDEARNHRQEESRDERVHGRSEGPSLHVCTS